MREKQKMTDFDVFVSYSTKDKTLVDALVHYLEEHKIRCRYAGRDFVAGVPYPEQIVLAIEGAEVVIFILSANSSASPDCCRELEVASGSGCVIIPFKVDEAALGGTTKYYLKNIHWIEAFPEPEAHFGKLKEQISGLLEKNSATHQVDEPSVKAKEDQGEPEDLPSYFSRFTKVQKSFWRYFAERRSRRMKAVVAGLDRPTIKDLISASKDVYKDILDRCDNERKESPSFEQFIRVCDLARSVFERAIELSAESLESSGVLSSCFELMGRLPRGPAGRFNHAEADSMFETFQRVRDMMEVLYEDTYNMAKSCDVVFKSPLLLRTIPKGGSFRDLMFAKSGEEFRFRGSVFADMAEKYKNTEDAFSKMHPETPVDFFFDPELLYYQILVALNEDASFPSEPFQLNENAEKALRDPAVYKKLVEIKEKALQRWRDSSDTKN